MCRCWDGTQAVSMLDSTTELNLAPHDFLWNHLGSFYKPLGQEPSITGLHLPRLEGEKSKNEPETIRASIPIPYFINEIYLYLCVCMYMSCMCIPLIYRCLQNPGEGIEPLELGLQVFVSYQV